MVVGRGLIAVVTWRLRGIAGPRPWHRGSLPAVVLTLVLLTTVTAPAWAAGPPAPSGLRAGAPAPGWVADSGNAGAYTTSLSCPTASFCVAVNWNGQAVVFNGHGWGAPTILKPDQTTSEGTFGVPLTSVSCGSARFCMAVDNAGDAFTYDGTAWSGGTSIDPGTQLNSVSCPTTTYCRTIDVSGSVFAYDAGSWTSKPAFPGDLHVGCGSPSPCWYLGGAPTGGHAENTGAITCLPTPFCMLARSDGSISTWDGNPGLTLSPPTQVTPPQAGFSGVSCASETLCVALDGLDAIFYMYDGTSWTSSKYQGLGRLNAVSCVPGGICVAVDALGGVVSYPTALPESPNGGGTGTKPKPTTAQVRKSLVSLLRSIPVRSSIATLRHRSKTLRWTARYAGRLRLTLSVLVKGKRVTAATAKATYSKPVKGKIVLKPTRAAKRALTRKPPLRVVLDATFTPSRASAVSVSRTVVIRSSHAS